VKCFGRSSAHSSGNFKSRQSLASLIGTSLALISVDLDMQLLATSHTGVNGKGVELLALRLGAKVQKAAGFPMMLQKKVVEGAKPQAGETALQAGTGTNKRVTKAEEKETRREMAAGPETLLAISASVVIPAKAGSVALAKVGSETSLETSQAKESLIESLIAHPRPEAGAEPLLRTLAPGVGVEGDRQATKSGGLDFGAKPHPRQDRGQSEPPPTGKDAEEESGSGRIRPSNADAEVFELANGNPSGPIPKLEQEKETIPIKSSELLPKVLEVVNEVSLSSAPELTPEVPGVIAAVMGTRQKQSGRPGELQSDARNMNPDEPPRLSTGRVNEPEAQPKITGPAESRADGAGTSSGSKKVKIEPERLLAPETRGSHPARTYSGERTATQGILHGAGEFAGVVKSGPTGDARVHHPVELEPSARPAPVAFHSLRLTEQIAGPELHFNWRSPEAGDIQLSTSLHHRDVQMIVNAERADTAAAMRAELPSLDHRLHEHSLRLGEVNIVAQERSLSTGLAMSGQDRGHREWNVPAPFTRGPEETRRETKVESLLTAVPSDGRVSVLA
jgi:hypothetical protein